LYFKNMDMRDVNAIVKRLGTRVKELDAFLSELQFLAKSNLNDDITLDLDQLTLMGHGFGATTAIALASKDDRVKKIVTYDPWLTPLKDEILSRVIQVK
jgi:pimeloyl-ACP methyl ester carboxylesterase